MSVIFEDGLKDRIEAFYKGETAWWLTCQLFPTKSKATLQFFEDDVKESGQDGLRDLLKANADKILICLMRVEASDEQRVSQKFIFITYIGTGVSVMTRSKVGTYSYNIQQAFSKKHVTKSYDTSDLGELEPAQLSKDLLNVGGAHMPNKFVFGKGDGACWQTGKGVQTRKDVNTSKDVQIRKDVQTRIDVVEEKESILADQRIVQKTVAVTGASGYIGSAVTNLLLEKGYKVHATVRDPTNPAKVAHLKSLPNADDNLVLFKADLLEDGSFDEVFKECHGVFHTASPLPSGSDDPENEIIKPALLGTENVLRSCQKAGVKVVVVTSSMAAAAPKPRPPVLSEKHWSDPDEQKQRGSWYGASKTLAERAAVEFLAKMSVDSAFRLVRICPTMVVGPMLQPSVNTSMKYFAQCARGVQEERIRNDSMSFIDVRDCAAHHVAAYEGNHEGRFFSLVESWHWSMIYTALKLFNPDMKSPKPMEEGTKPERASQFDHTRMRTLGVNERSVVQLIEQAVDVCRERGLLSEVK